MSPGEFFFDLFIPHFTEEYVALELNDNGNCEIACCIQDTDEGEVFPRMCLVKSLTWFGYGFFPKAGEIEPYDREKGLAYAN